MQLWACCAAHKAAALREVLKVRTLRFYSCSTWQCLLIPARLASVAHWLSVCRGDRQEMPFLSIAQQAGRACEVSDQLLAEA